MLPLPSVGCWEEFACVSTNCVRGNASYGLCAALEVGNVFDAYGALALILKLLLLLACTLRT
jgi:hypothetical protein